MHKIILHIDMNSYFATVEQQCNPFLRGKPIAIGGSPGTRSIIVAASIEAKQYGVKTGMNHFEAKQCCPMIQFIDGDLVKYGELTKLFINICKRYTDRIEVYSIDELFMDLTNWVDDYHQACAVAQRIKQSLKKEVGDYLSCSVGVAPNKMMAKLASDMKKPNGLVVIEEDDIKTFLQWVELTDMPGIGRRLKIRLFDMGIRTLEQLGGYPVTELQKVFGSNNGVMLSEMGRGIDHSSVPYVHEVEPAKSMGHTYTLPKDTKDRDRIYSVLLKLSEKVGRRLRRDEYQGRYVWVWLRWEDFSGNFEGKTLKHFVDDGYEIYHISKTMLAKWVFFQPVRLVGVGLSLLKHKGRQLPILSQDKRRERLVGTQDKINDRYGEFTIQRAGTLKTFLNIKVGGFKQPHQFD